MSTLDAVLEAWGRANPDQMTLPNGAPNPFFVAVPKQHGQVPTPAPVIPNFGKRLDSSQPSGEANPDPDLDPHPKRHGSLSALVPPRTVHYV
jgi:hypothetical protein